MLQPFGGDACYRFRGANQAMRGAADRQPFSQACGSHAGVQVWFPERSGRVSGDWLVLRSSPLTSWGFFWSNLEESPCFVTLLISLPGGRVGPSGFFKGVRT